MMSNKTLHLKIVKGNAKKAACPLCQRAAAAPHIPFCSHRCAQLDLGKWLTEYYAVADHEAMDERDIEVLLAANKSKNVWQVGEDS